MWLRLADGVPARPLRGYRAAQGRHASCLDHSMSREADSVLPADAPQLAARESGLRWVTDNEAGIRRRRRGHGFVYLQPDGRLLRDAGQLDRIRRLAIPPAYRDVWICPRADGHLQATGRDSRGRKQYRYHADWLSARGRTKFERLHQFGLALPRIRDRVRRQLAGDDGEPATRERVLATLVRLLDTTWLRIGNVEYARSNGSFGLSTLRAQHVAVRGGELRLSFQGKSGVRHDVVLTDRRVAGVVRRCRELPGQELFRYVDGDGSTHSIGSADVNDWLADAAGARITAKDFRTWHGSVQALDLTLAACAVGAPPCRPAEVLATVARRLGNTVAVCRKAYIHPQVMALGSAITDAAARERMLSHGWVRRAPAIAGLTAAERRLIGLLRWREPARATTRAKRPPERQARR